MSASVFVGVVEEQVVNTVLATYHLIAKPRIVISQTGGVEVSSNPTRAALALGARSFRDEYGVLLAYTAGAMYKGIASKEMVVAMGKAALMSYLGTGGLDSNEIESSIHFIQSHLEYGQPYGMNLLHSPSQPALEERTVDLFLKHNIRYVEAAAYMDVTPSIVRYRLKGLTRSATGEIIAPHHILAKISRPEVASAFMRPAPERIVSKLVQEGHLSQQEGELANRLPVAGQICVEADSGGHTDRGVACVLVPVILALRERVMKEYGYEQDVHVGSAGGIGTPEAAAAAFAMGVDFITTGSINQCTVEAGTSDSVKNILQDMTIQDTAYAPAGDMFELGAKVQVLKKGIFFPFRAAKLYDLYMRYGSIEDIDMKTRKMIEDKYFKRSFDEVWNETKTYYAKMYPETINQFDRNPKHKMAAIFKWYFVHSSRLAREGKEEEILDYQVHSGPALGAFNEWVKDSSIEQWRNRHVSDIAVRIMNGAADMLISRVHALVEPAVGVSG
jgi:trans-AT polyketide synthase, acyltransferase and oxidoreductase domains